MPDNKDPIIKTDIEVNRLFSFIEDYCKHQVDLEYARHSDSPKDKIVRIQIISLSILLITVIICAQFICMRTIDGYKGILDGLIIIEQSTDIESDAQLYKNDINLVEGVNNYEDYTSESNS